MAIPKFESFLHPFMQCVSDGRAHTLSELCEYCAKYFQLTEEDQAETIPSGKSRLYDRVYWGSQYLKKAGLVLAEKRGVYAVTDEGIRSLAEKKTIDLSYLKKYPSFLEYYSSSNKISHVATVDMHVGEKQLSHDEQKTPAEMIEAAMNQLNSSLSDDLLAEIQKISPWDFEKLIVKLLIKMGYGNLQQNIDAVTPKSGDEGIDGVVTADEFGFDSVYIQAKKWKQDSVVGRPEIMKFMGALAGQGATKGLFVTTTKFSKEAIEYAGKQLQHKIILVDGKKLADLMIKYNLGVSVANTIEIKKIDADFFNNEL